MVDAGGNIINISASEATGRDDAVEQISADIPRRRHGRDTSGPYIPWHDESRGDPLSTIICERASSRPYIT